MAGRRTPPETERAVVQDIRNGLPVFEVAERYQIHPTTVDAILKRAPQAPLKEPALPAVDEARLTDDEARDKLRHARDAIIELLPLGIQRLSKAFAVGDQARDPANALAPMLRELNRLDQRCRLATLIADMPETREDRERAYTLLLWEMATDGSVPAARALAKAWGVDAVADRGTTEVIWACDDDDDQTTATADSPAKDPGE
jgi:hypothetical protein